MAGEFEGKVALVTGASMGIGRASALAFARRGAKVVVADVDVAGGEETVRLIRKAGGEAIFAKTDVSNAADVEALAKKTVATYGKLDYAHNNAAINRGIGVMTAAYKEEDWNIQVDVNLKGVFLCMKYEIPEMLKNPPRIKLPQGEYGKGVIVNTSSIGGVLGMPGATGYQATKAAVIQMTRVAAVDYCTKGIRVMAVLPGIIKTRMAELAIGSKPGGETIVGSLTPMARMGEPEEVAGPVVFLCSDEASYMTGSYIAVDGGALIPMPPTPKVF